MALNWKIKLTKKTQIWGNETGNSLDDLDKVASALSLTKDQCYDQITSIRVKKIDIWSAENIDSIQFTYSIDTKDKTGVEVLGNKHGGSTGTLQTWTFASDWLVRVNGKRGDYTTQGYYNIIRWLQFKSFYVNETNHDTWQGEKGTNAGTDFSMIAPACFFSRGGNLLYAFGCYQGELYNADAKIASDNLKIWTETFKPKTAEQIKKDLEAGTTATTDLSKWTSTFKDYKTPELLQAEITRLTNNQEKHTDYDKIKGDLEKWTNTFTNLAPEAVLTKYNEPKEVHTDYEQISNERNSWTILFPSPLTPQQVKNKYDEPKEQHTAEQLEKHTPEQLKPDDYADNMAKLADWQNTFPNQKPNEIKQQLTQPSQPSTQSDKYLNKLLEIYQKEIKKRTELFYQELSLDNNKINAKYGNPSISYLDRLKDLKGESDPEQVINAFKIVALELATEFSQEESDKLSKLSKVPAPLKKNKLNYFQKVKDNWDLIKDEPTANNNPLYLDVITKKSDYITQINNIITLWQNK